MSDRQGHRYGLFFVRKYFIYFQYQQCFLKKPLHLLNFQLIKGDHKIGNWRRQDAGLPIWQRLFKLMEMVFFIKYRLKTAQAFFGENEKQVIECKIEIVAAMTLTYVTAVNLTQNPQ
jgi:hypothetical protein